jgi:hypothetical protein
LAAWEPALAGRGQIRRFNWAAFLFGVQWVGFRRMYRLGFTIIAVLLTATALEDAAFGPPQGITGPPGLLTGVVGLIVSLNLGMNGNYWYLVHARRQIARVRVDSLDARLSLLRRRGEPRWAAGVGMAFVYILGVLALRLAIIMASDAH